MTRIDVWLWSVRVYKSRSLATAAVKGGHIRLNGDPVKPSHDVKPGDTVTIHTPRMGPGPQGRQPDHEKSRRQTRGRGLRRSVSSPTRLPLGSPRSP